MATFNQIYKYTITNGGGTVNLSVSDSNTTRYVFSGTATLIGNWVIQPSGSPAEGTEFDIRWQAPTTIGANSVTIFGRALTAYEALQDLQILCYYNGSAWDVDVIIDNILWQPGTGTNSRTLIVGGNTVTGTGAFSDGTNGCDSSGDYSYSSQSLNTASGDYSRAKGDGTIASANYSDSGGRDAKAIRYGEFARGSGVGAITTEKRQLSFLTASAETSDATPTLLSLNGTTGELLSIEENSLVEFDCKVIAFQRDGIAGTPGDAATWNFNGTIRNLGGTTALLDTVMYQDNTGAWGVSAQRAQDAAAAAWTVAATANNATDSLSITVTGEVNKGIVWLAYIQFTEIKLIL